MTFYASLGFSSCELAGAVAEAAIHDLRVNLFSFPGFPQISITADKDYLFTATLSWEESKVKVTLTKSEAIAAVNKFKNKQGFDSAIFDRVQKELAKLEGLSSEAGRLQVNQI